jgi:hypothetical protein
MISSACANDERGPASAADAPAAASAAHAPIEPTSKRVEMNLTMNPPCSDAQL